MHMQLPCFPVQLSNCALSAVFQHHNNNSPAWLSTVCSGALVSVVTAEWCHIIWRRGGARLCCREYSMVRHGYFSSIRVSVSVVIVKSLHMHAHVHLLSMAQLVEIVEYHNWKVKRECWQRLLRHSTDSNKQTCIRNLHIFETWKLDFISLFFTNK